MVDRHYNHELQLQLKYIGSVYKEVKTDTNCYNLQGKKMNCKYDYQQIFEYAINRDTFNIALLFIFQKFNLKKPISSLNNHHIFVKVNTARFFNLKETTRLTGILKIVKTYSCSITKVFVFLIYFIQFWFWVFNQFQTIHEVI